MFCRHLRESTGRDKTPGIRRHRVIVGAKVQREVRTAADAGQTRTAEGKKRRRIFRSRNRIGLVSGFAKNGDAPTKTAGVTQLNFNQGPGFQVRNSRIE